MERQVAIVTGGSGGMAPGLIAALLEANFRVIITARRPSELGDAVAKLEAMHGREVIAIPADVTDAHSTSGLVAQILERFGRVDVLVNAAASSTPIGGSIEDIDVGALIRDLDVKVGGYLRMIQAVVPAMKSAGAGRIVNIGGLTGRSSDTLSGLRNVAVAHLTKVLSDQLARFGITVNAVHPGLVRTPHLAELFEKTAASKGGTAASVEHEFVAAVPVGHLLEPIEIGRAVAFLAGPNAAAITGESLTVDGGYSRGIYL
jgi:NAD(P)-dependent dehydrogenase (short-subunit alcohol dehydrogenase family)